MIMIRTASVRRAAGVLPVLAALLFFTLLPAHVHGQAAPVRLVTDRAGTRLQVDGKDFMVIGMNWDYFPIGKNYAYSLWTQPDDVIEAALDGEMSLLKDLGVNAIRQYTGVPPRWVRYIYERYGIWTILNHSLGRYGVTVGGVYVPQTDYSDPQARAQLLGEITAIAEEFRGVPGLLMYLLGNENNYGLEWSSAETEALPEGERQAAKARYLYSLMGEASRAIKERDGALPVAIANGDLQYLDIIASEAKGIDVLGTNMYRGISFGDAFERVKKTLGIPIMFTEFGADAFDARHHREDQLTQARYLLGQWQEIYAHSSGKGGTGNAIGGLTFQFSDGWWKFQQESNLDVHDINASWPNDAYREDFVPGENNMNEEWWGICAKGPTDSRGLYELYPRAAYYALREAYRLDPYAPSTTTDVIARHFAAIEPAGAALQARGDRGAMLGEETQRLRISGMRLEMSTFNTGGSNVSTPDEAPMFGTTRPAFRGFDHLESFYAEVEARPAENVSGTISFNVLGHVPVNPIDELFYEDRGRARTVAVDGQPEQMTDIDRIKVYRAQVSWDDSWFRLDGFYRTGHYHWGYEGDFFGLYREANYGPNIDIYNGEAPLGMEITGKKALDGLKVALGPELWWGANPAVLLKYRRQLGPVLATAIYQEDLDKQGAAVSSFAVPLPPTRKATLHLKTGAGPFGIEVGGIWSGDTKTGELFQVVDGEAGSYRVLQDRITGDDAFGGKAKLTVSSGRWNWYLQGAAMGLVADGGPTSVLTFPGWHRKDNGLGNLRRARKPRDHRRRAAAHLRSHAGDMDVRMGQRRAGGRSLRRESRFHFPSPPDHAGRGNRLPRRQDHVPLRRRSPGTGPLGELCTHRLAHGSASRHDRESLRGHRRGEWQRRPSHPPLRRRRAPGHGFGQALDDGEGQRLGSLRLPSRLQPHLPPAADRRSLLHPRHARLVQPAADALRRPRCVAVAGQVLAAVLSRSDTERLGHLRMRPRRSRRQRQRMGNPHLSSSRPGHVTRRPPSEPNPVFRRTT